MSEIVYFKDHRGIKEWEVTITDHTNYYCDMAVREIASWVEGDDGVYDVPCDYEDYLECSIKWDSCSHFRFGEVGEDGTRDAYLHICGVDYYKKHVALMEKLYNLAFKTMGREPMESEVWS